MLGTSFILAFPAFPRLGRLHRVSELEAKNIEMYQ